jgi:hypothetical protein
MNFQDIPASTIFEFVSTIFVASLLAGVGVYFAGSMPIPVTISVGVTHLHAYLFMKDVRKHTDDPTVVKWFRKLVWKFECVSCLAALATAALVFTLTV